MANNELKFMMQFQPPRSNWCWAATTTSVSQFYNPMSPWYQCGVVCDTLKRSDCCILPIPDDCNIPYFLEDALKTTGNLKLFPNGAEFRNGVLSQAEIKNEIDNKFIIGVRIGWRAGGGHFVAIHGYDDTKSELFLYISDPIYDKKYLSLSEFALRYKTNGRWTHSYLTQGRTNMLEFTKINENLLFNIKNINLDNLLLKEGALANLQEKVRDKNDNTAVEVYSLDLEALKFHRDLEFISDGIRILDNNAGGRELIYEFSGLDRDAKFKQIIFGESYLEKYKSKLKELIANFSGLKEKYIVKQLQIPELKVDAIWLSSDHFIFDFIAPLYSNNFLDDNKYYGGADFLQLVQENIRDLKGWDIEDRLGG